jgi:hypothetical protein
MFGSFQSSALRIEVDASAALLRESLTSSAKLQQWLCPQRLSTGLPEYLTPGLSFTSGLGPIAIEHQVERLDASSLCFLLSGGIDGFHAWSWGDGWVQSQLEGVTLLPLNLSQTLSLWRLRQFLQLQQSSAQR